MDDKKYDKYKLIVFEQPNFGLITVVEYYKKDKLINTKRSANQNFIIELIEQAIVDIQKINIDDKDLVINTNFKGHVIIKNYKELKKRNVFSEINIKIEQKFSKKEATKLVGVKNLRVTRDKEKLKKIKLMKNKALKPITLAFVLTSQIIMINKFLPEYKPPINNVIESPIENNGINISNEKDIIKQELNNGLNSIKEKMVIDNNENSQLSESLKLTNIDDISKAKAIQKKGDNINFKQSKIEIKDLNKFKDFNILKELNNVTLKRNSNIEPIIIKKTIKKLDNSYKSVVPTYRATSYNNVLTDQEFNQLVAMVESEAGGNNIQDHYTEALAVTSIVLNRLEDEKWHYSCGGSIMEQVHASGQFSGVQSDTYKLVIDNPEKASPEVVQAVKDCLSGIRNNPYLEFRGKENKAPGRIQFVEDGNNYFGLPEIAEKQNNFDEQKISNMK